MPTGVAGLALFAGTAPGFMALDDPFTVWSPFALVTRALFGAAGWCRVAAVLGLLDRPREVRPPSRVMVYPGTAALPVYVLHQPVVVGRPAPIAVEYAVIVAGSPTLILVRYEGVVRRTRLLFGMRAGPPVVLPVRPPDPPVAPAR